MTLATVWRIGDEAITRRIGTASPRATGTREILYASDSSRPNEINGNRRGCPVVCEASLHLRGQPDVAEGTSRFFLRGRDPFRLHQVTTPDNRTAAPVWADFAVHRAHLPTQSDRRNSQSRGAAVPTRRFHPPSKSRSDPPARHSQSTHPHPKQRVRCRRAARYRSPRRLSRP